MAVQDELCWLVFLTTVTGVLGGEYCFYGSGSLKTRWCSYGCCNFDCCDANLGLIIGLTALGIVVVCTIIVVVCCCLRRRRAAHGTVIQTNPGPGVVVASSQNTSMASPGQPMYPTGAYQPEVYGGPAPQPYAMGQQYPPGPQPYGAPAPQLYGAPAPQPGTAATAPPSYDQAAGAQVNPAFDSKAMN